MSYVENLGSRFEKHYGKYRGKVLENADPFGIGRILAEVAAVSGMDLNWCMPCTPYAGSDVGFYAIPPIGANVWIEFEGGDTNYPIWSGCFWERGETPTAGEIPANPEIKIFKTAFSTFIMNDTPEAGGITLECHPPAVTVPLSMVFDTTGITILAPPASLTMITEEGITLTFPPDVISMTEETIEITVPPSVITMNSGAIDLMSPTVDTTAEGAVSVMAGGEMSLEAAGMISLLAAAEVSVTAAADVMVTAPTFVITSMVNITGVLEVSGAILEAGQPVLVI